MFLQFHCHSLAQRLQANKSNPKFINSYCTQTSFFCVGQLAGRHRAKSSHRWNPVIDVTCGDCEILITHLRLVWCALAEYENIYIRALRNTSAFIWDLCWSWSFIMQRVYICPDSARRSLLVRVTIYVWERTMFWMTADETRRGMKDTWRWTRHIWCSHSRPGWK